MKTKLVCTSPTKTILGNELNENPVYTQCVNSETDIQFGQVASAQLSFSTQYSSLTKSTVIDYYTWQNCDSDWRLIGKFYVSDIRKHGNTYSITAYDAVSKLDKDCSAFLKTTSANTVYSLYTSLVTWCGLTHDNPSQFIVNGGMAVTPGDLVSAGITARTVMHYIAEAVGGYVIAKPNGKIYLDIFGVPGGGSPQAVTASEYSQLTLADQVAPKPTAINVQLSSGNCTYPSAGTSAEMVYLFNPLFYNKAEADIRSNVQAIYSRITTLYNNYGQNGGLYYACTFHLFDDMKINAGDVIKVDGKTVYVFSKTINDSGCEIVCTGEPQRTPVVTENTDRITALEGDKYSDNYLTSDWMTDGSTKTFNAPILTSDILIPNGLGFLNNASNISLVTVIQALLTATGLDIGTINQSIVLRVSNVGYGYGDTTFTTPYNSSLSGIAYSKTGSTTVTQDANGFYVIGVSSGYNSGTVTFSVNGVTKAQYSVTPVTTMFKDGTTYPIPYPSTLDYENCAVWVYDYSTSTYVVTGAYADFSNSHLSMEWSEADSCLYTVWNTGTTKPRRYRVIFCDKDHNDPSTPVETSYYYVED